MGVCIPGFVAAGARRGRYGVAVVFSEKVCECAGVFTKNSVKAAPVKYTKRRVKNGFHAIVANSGNANCCIPEAAEDAKSMADSAAKALGVSACNVAVSSTGIIGRRMDVAEVNKAAADAAKNLRCSADASLEAAKAIMTTDSVPKMYSAESGDLMVGGICKGAGMIAPNMATMLCFLTTNADFSQKKLQDVLSFAVEDSFNMVSVEGDMSTNDTVLLMSSRTTKCKIAEFKKLLAHVCAELAKKIAEDGEGATKFMEVHVKGAPSLKDARKAVKAITDSPLVKTAIYGENPNWGRVVACAGSVVRVEEEMTTVAFESGKDSATVYERGNALGLEKAKKILKNREVRIVLDLGRGRHNATGWGCDMSPEYVNINAGYN